MKYFLAIMLSLNLALTFYTLVHVHNLLVHIECDMKCQNIDLRMAFWR